MLKLEKALASCIKAEHGPGSPECTRLEAALAAIRPVADSLFQVALAEARQGRVQARESPSLPDFA